MSPSFSVGAWGVNQLLGAVRSGHPLSLAQAWGEGGQGLGWDMRRVSTLSFQPPIQPI